MNQLKLGVPAIKVLTDELGIFDTKNNISSSKTKVITCSTKAFNLKILILIMGTINH